MQDDHLLQDLEALSAYDLTIKTLRDHGVTTYTRLFEVVRDESADSELRIDACAAISELGGFYTESRKLLDKRRALPALVAALKSKDQPLRERVTRTLADLRSPGAVPHLV